MDLEQFSSLITNSSEIVMVGIAFLSMVIAGLQAIFLLKTLEVAKNFEKDHKRRLEIEREYHFAESALRILQEIDLEMESMFNKEILDSPSLKNEIERINSNTDGYTLLGFKKPRYFYFRWLAFSSNFPERWKKINKLSTDLNFYLGYFESKEMMDLKWRLIFSGKALGDWMNKSFPELAEKKFNSLEEYIEHFNKEIESIFPDTMLTETPLVKRYNKYRDALTEKLFKILKGGS